MEKRLSDKGSLFFLGAEGSGPDSAKKVCRNKTKAPVFKKLGIIDQWGNGLIATEMNSYPEIGYEWFEKGLYFQVQFIKRDPYL